MFLFGFNPKTLYSATFKNTGRVYLLIYFFVPQLDTYLHSARKCGGRPQVRKTCSGDECATSPTPNAAGAGRGLVEAETPPRSPPPPDRWEADGLEWVLASRALRTTSASPHPAVAQS